MASAGKVVVYAPNRFASLIRSKVMQQWPEVDIDMRNPKYFSPDNLDFQDKSKDRVLAVVIAGCPTAIYGVCLGRGVPVHRWTEAGDPEGGQDTATSPQEDSMEVHVWGPVQRAVDGALWGELAASRARNEFRSVSVRSREALAFTFTAKAEAMEQAEKGMLAGAVIEEGCGEIHSFYARLGVKVLSFPGPDEDAGQMAQAPAVRATESTRSGEATQGAILSFLKAGPAEFKVVVNLQDSLEFLKACAAAEYNGENREQYQRIVDARLRELRSANPYLEDRGDVGEAEREAAKAEVVAAQIAQPQASTTPAPTAEVKKEKGINLEDASLEEVVEYLNGHPDEEGARALADHILSFPAKEIASDCLTRFTNIKAVSLLLEREKGSKKRATLLKLLVGMSSKPD